MDAIFCRPKRESTMHDAGLLLVLPLLLFAWLVLRERPPRRRRPQPSRIH